jgi:hypothetical protein
MFAATQQIASVAGLKATKVQVCAATTALVLSFLVFVFNNNDLIIGVLFSQQSALLIVRIFFRI